MSGVKSKHKMSLVNDLLGRIYLDINNVKYMTKNQLAYLVEEANNQYFNTNGPPIFPDNVYDRVKEELCSKWPDHPLCNSVGAPMAHNNTDKVSLPCWMGSLDKIKDKDIDKWMSRYHGPYVVSDKLDGISALMTIRNGKPTSLFTRGDGNVGENATFVLEYIQGVPKKVAKNISLVRGELILPRSLNVKNARAVIVGAVNAKTNVRDDVLKNAHFVAYELINSKETFEKQLATLDKNNFEVVWNTAVSDLNNLSGVLAERRSISPYDVDGIVVSDSSTVYPRVTEGNPDYSFAFKSLLTQDMAEVMVTSVQWEISKDNYLIPTILYEPVELNGVVMKKATGFNAKYVIDNVIGPGSRIVVVRSGDVIPYIFEVLQPAMSGRPDMPSQPFEWSDTGVDAIATTSSPELEVRRITYFYEKIGTRGVSLKTIKAIYDSGKAQSIFEFLQLTPRDLMEIPRFQETLSTNIVDAITKAMSSCTTLDIMVGSNIFGRGLGEKKLRTILSAYPKLDKKLTVADLMKLDGFAQKTAEKFVENLPTFLEFLKSIGKKIEREETGVVDKDLNGMVVVFTGFRDKDLEEKIVARGGRVVTSVSSNVTLLVAKDVHDNSSKVVNARKLGIHIVSPDEFLRII